eukprot:m51a1_g3410 hypothetical protein (858) ;mRNA; f:566917-570231
MSAKAAYTLKLTVDPGGEIRRVPVPALVYDDVRSRIASWLVPARLVAIKYIDEEGDKVTVASQEELEAVPVSDIRIVRLIAGAGLPVAALVFAKTADGIREFIQYVVANPEAVQARFPNLTVREGGGDKTPGEARFASQAFAFAEMVGRDDALRMLLSDYRSRFDGLRDLDLPAQFGTLPGPSDCRRLNRAFAAAAAPGAGKTRFVHELGRLGGRRLAELLGVEQGSEEFQDENGFAQSVERWQVLHVTYNSTTSLTDVELPENQMAALAARMLYDYLFAPLRMGALWSFFILAASCFGSSTPIPDLHPGDVLQAVFRHSGRKSMLLTVDETRVARNPVDLARTVVELQDQFSLPGVAMLYTFITSINILDPALFSDKSSRGATTVPLGGLSEEMAQALFFKEFPALDRIGVYRCAVADAGGHPRTLEGVRIAAKALGERATYVQIAKRVKEALLRDERIEWLTVPMIRAAFLARSMGPSSVIGSERVEDLIASGFFDNSASGSGSDSADIVPRISMLRMWVWARFVLNCVQSRVTEEKRAVASAIDKMLDQSAWQDPVNGHAWECFVAQHHALMQRFLCGEAATEWVPLKDYLRGALLGSAIVSLQIELFRDVRFIDKTTEFFLDGTEWVPGQVVLFKHEQEGFEGLFVARVRNEDGSGLRIVFFVFECKYTVKKIGPNGKEEKPSRTDLASVIEKLLGCMKVLAGRQFVLIFQSNRRATIESAVELPGNVAFMGESQLSQFCGPSVASRVHLGLDVSSGSSGNMQMDEDDLVDEAKTIKERAEAARQAIMAKDVTRIHKADLLALVLLYNPSADTQSGSFEHCLEAACAILHTTSKEIMWRKNKRPHSECMVADD